MNTQLKFPERKICLFSNYRAGSTMFAGRISNVNKVMGIGEHFTGVKYKYYSFDKAMKSLESMKGYALKLMADQVDYDDDHIESILKNSDRIIYLYRKNFKAQVMSFISANITGTFALFGLPETSQQSDQEIIINALTEETIVAHADIIQRNYEKMAEFYKKYPGDIYCLEDLEQKPYRKITTWSQPTEQIMNYIPDFDVEKTILG